MRRGVTYFSCILTSFSSGSFLTKSFCLNSPVCLQWGLLLPYLTCSWVVRDNKFLCQALSILLGIKHLDLHVVQPVVDLPCFRFMATNDLMMELQKDSIKLDEDSEKKVVKMLLKLLEDKNGEVQNLAVKW